VGPDRIVVLFAADRPLPQTALLALKKGESGKLGREGNRQPGTPPYVCRQVIERRPGGSRRERWKEENGRTWQTSGLQ